MTDNVSTALATRAQGQSTAVVKPEQRVAAYLDKMKAQIALALPKHLTPDRLARIALTTIRTNPKLLQCSIESLMGAVMQAAQLGLEPGLLGHCYLIPYGTEAQFIIGYRGMIDLARRSGEIESVNAHEVYENDYIFLEYGIREDLKHVPWHIRTDAPQAESGKLRGAYMVARFKDGGYYVHYMPKAELDAHRARSKASGSGPWVTDYIEMVKKTVVRAAFKWLPISVEVAKQVAGSDETVKREIAPDMTDVIDLTPEPPKHPEMNPETGEVPQEPKTPAESPQDEPRRGRPPGSRNKPKSEDEPEKAPAPAGEKVLTLAGIRARANEQGINDDFLADYARRVMQINARSLIEWTQDDLARVDMMLMALEAGSITVEDLTKKYDEAS